MNRPTAFHYYAGFSTLLVATQKHHNEKIILEPDYRFMLLLVFNIRIQRLP